MAFFDNYTTLQSTVADYLARSDLTDEIPEFIRLGEIRLSRDLRIRQMLKVATAVATTGDSTVSLPSDFLAMKDLHFQGNPVNTIEFLSTSNFFRNAGTSYKGRPNFYTLLGSEFQFAPIPDSNYTLQMVYYYKPEYLSGTNPSNLWMAYTPDLLLYATLGEAEPYLMNDERLQTWASMYDRGVTALTKSDDDSEYPGTPLSITISKR
tara:strand:+ start:332 stop:955 length:624 start_codon:yes stop_codon:yes gene_type:complete